MAQKLQTYLHETKNKSKLINTVYFWCKIFSPINLAKFASIIEKFGHFFKFSTFS